MKSVFAPDPLLLKMLPQVTPKAGVIYVPSQFALPFDYNGKQYVFNTLTKQCLETVLPKQAKAGEGFDPLIETRFLVPEGKDECALYESISAALRLTLRKKETLGYVILPTLFCTARCVYCYEEGRPQERMKPETVEAVLRYILAHRGNENVRLSWFGGEPLLCPDIIDRISTGLRDAGVSFTSTVVSNGSLITPAILEKMRGLWNTKSIQISMDGAEPDYIVQKNYYSNTDQYHTVMENISRLSEAGITVALRVNVDESNWPGIPQFMDDLKRCVKNKDHVLVYFSPLMQVRAGENDLVFWEKVLSAAHLITDAGFKPLLYTDPAPRFRIVRCMADSGSVVIGPDGSLYPCEHCGPESRYGDVFRGVTDPDVEHAFRRADQTREMCRKCPLLPNCTSYAACPWVDTHCRESHEMLTVSALRRWIDQNGPQETDADENDLTC